MTTIEWLVVGVWLLVWGVCVLAIWINELRKRVKRLEHRVSQTEIFHLEAV